MSNKNTINIRVSVKHASNDECSSSLSGTSSTSPESSMVGYFNRKNPARPYHTISNKGTNDSIQITGGTTKALPSPGSSMTGSLSTSSTSSVTTKPAQTVSASPKSNESSMTGSLSGGSSVNRNSSTSSQGSNSAVLASNKSSQSSTNGSSMTGTLGGGSTVTKTTSTSSASTSVSRPSTNPTPTPAPRTAPSSTNSTTSPTVKTASSVQPHEHVEPTGSKVLNRISFGVGILSALLFVGGFIGTIFSFVNVTHDGYTTWIYIQDLAHGFYVWSYIFLILNIVFFALNIYYVKKETKNNATVIHAIQLFYMFIMMVSMLNIKNNNYYSEDVISMYEPSEGYIAAEVLYTLSFLATLSSLVLDIVKNKKYNQ